MICQGICFTPASSDHATIIAALSGSAIAFIALVVSIRSLRHSRRSSYTGILAQHCLDLLFKLRKHQQLYDGFLRTPFRTVKEKEKRYEELQKSELEVFAALALVQDLHDLGRILHEMWSQALAGQDSFFSAKGALEIQLTISDQLQRSFGEQCERIRNTVRSAMERGYPRGVLWKWKFWQ